MSSKMSESCSVCGKNFEVLFRWQMEEKAGAYTFLCGRTCQEKHVSGASSDGVICDCCGKRFVVELVAQVLKVGTHRRYACTSECRTSLVAEYTPALPMTAPAPPVAARTAAPPVFVPPTMRPAAPAASASPRSPATARASTPAPPLAVAPPVVAPAASASEESAKPAAPVLVRKPFEGPRRLAIFNHKGGTGKTTTTVSIAAGLAARGYRVLLVDTDSQGNVAVSLAQKSEKSLYHVLVMGIRPQDVVVNVRENLDLLPSNETLAAAELYLAGRQNRDRVLKDRLAKIENEYDVVILDCSPSLSLMNQNALVYADGILVPVACDFLSLVGVRQVLKTVKNVNSLLHHPVQIFGVLPTFYDARARICRDAVDTLKQHFGERCLLPIRAATKIKEAPAQGKTIFEYAPDSNAAEDYLRVVDHLAFGTPASAGDQNANGGQDSVRPSEARAHEDRSPAASHRATGAA
jgi:chromosome partitioning protein